MGIVSQVMEVLATLFVIAIGLGVLVIIVLYIIDVTQTRHTIRRNFPVVGRFRYFFEHLGEFFRQYFFAMDREELPFNRAERAWVYRASKGIDSTVAFGSTRDLRRPGTAVFVNCAYPKLDEEITPPEPLVIGPYTKNPYTPTSFFHVSAMSYGAISKPAVLALSAGAQRAGCWLNTGEGGLSPHHLEGGADVVFQMGTAKYGARTEDGKLDEEKLREVTAHEQVKMVEIKLSQGAKPGKGGILPGAKVTAEIARIRGIPKGQDSISPNRHPDIDSASDLLDFINRVRDISGKPVGFKSVIGAYGWLDDVCQEINRRGPESAPDFITIDSGDGGTGAAPMALMDNVGLQIKESLPLVVKVLQKHDLRERIRVNVSGKLINPSEVAWALCAGADFVSSARGFMFALGCIQALQCNKNSCPTGITTHNKKLQRGLVPANKATRVYQFHKNMVKEVNIIAHSCGVNEPRQLQMKHCRIVQANGKSVPMEQLYG
ncbi:MAG: FMN-binding glutamate synthase family protein [Gammaproteobacteria bacterium]|nr:FMN-binding glutamate synthase family protein [Gammaproteobacteria bacterium]